MGWCGGMFWSGAVHAERAPKTGRPQRDRSKAKAARRSRKRNR